MRRTNTDRFRWYHLVYRFFYRIGLVFWERRASPPDLIELVEGAAPLPAGRALDLGCGTGTDTIYLATHGWEVTGIDMVPKALSIARRKAAAVGTSPRFVEGDVTRLQDLGLGDHTLVLDFGCYHTLPEDRRNAYVTGVSSVTVPGGTLLLYGFRRPPRAAPMHAGVTVDEVRDRFGRHDWQLIDAEPASLNALRVRGQPADERFELWRFRLQHAPS